MERELLQFVEESLVSSLCDFVECWRLAKIGTAVAFHKELAAIFCGCEKGRLTAEQVETFHNTFSNGSAGSLLHRLVKAELGPIQTKILGAKYVSALT